MSKTNKYRLLTGACLALAASQGVALTTKQVCYEGPDINFVLQTYCKDVIEREPMPLEEVLVTYIEDKRTTGSLEEQDPNNFMLLFHTLPEYQEKYHAVYMRLLQTYSYGKKYYPEDYLLLLKNHPEYQAQYPGEFQRLFDDYPAFRTKYPDDYRSAVVSAPIENDCSTVSPTLGAPGAYRGNAQANQLKGQDPTGSYTLLGLARNDLLCGGDANDRLDGGTGKDVLIGGGGDDILTGGPGRDTFRFAPGWGKDTIRDFKQGSDWLYFDGLSALDVVLTPKRGGVLLTWGSGADSIFFRRASAEDIRSSWSFSEK